MDSRLLLGLLREKNDYISGEDLSKYLGVSRTAVWKHVRQLKIMGYEIEAVPHRGYKLMGSPDAMLADEIASRIQTKVLGNKLICCNETTSTNDLAMNMAREGEPEGTVVVAEYQSRGRGRREREWVSEKGKNLLFSIIFRPPWVAEQGPLLTLMAAVATVKAINRICHVGAQIKWPNDIVWEGKKIAGILTEMQAQMDGIAFVVCGIGINVNQVPSLAGEGNAVTSLEKVIGHAVMRVPLLTAILMEIEIMYFQLLEKGNSVLMFEWESLSYLQHKRVWLRLPDGRELEGDVWGLHENGALRIKMADGSITTITCGEVALCRQAGKGKQIC